MLSEGSGLRYGAGAWALLLPSAFFRYPCRVGRTQRRPTSLTTSSHSRSPPAKCLECISHKLEQAPPLPPVNKESLKPLKEEIEEALLLLPAMGKTRSFRIRDAALRSPETGRTGSFSRTGLIRWYCERKLKSPPSAAVIQNAIQRVQESRCEEKDEHGVFTPLANAIYMQLIYEGPPTRFRLTDAVKFFGHPLRSDHPSFHAFEEAREASYEQVYNIMRDNEVFCPESLIKQGRFDIKAIEKAMNEESGSEREAYLAALAAIDEPCSQSGSEESKSVASRLLQPDNGDSHMIYPQHCSDMHNLMPQRAPRPPPNFVCPPSQHPPRAPLQQTVYPQQPHPDFGSYSPAGSTLPSARASEPEKAQPLPRIGLNNPRHPKAVRDPLWQLVKDALVLLPIMGIQRNFRILQGAIIPPEIGRTGSKFSRAGLVRWYCERKLASPLPARVIDNAVAKVQQKFRDEQDQTGLLTPLALAIRLQVTREEPITTFTVGHAVKLFGHPRSEEKSHPDGPLAARKASYEQVYNIMRENPEFCPPVLKDLGTFDLDFMENAIDLENSGVYNTTTLPSSRIQKATWERSDCVHVYRPEHGQHSDPGWNAYAIRLDNSWLPRQPPPRGHPPPHEQPLRQLSPQHPIQYGQTQLEGNSDPPVGLPTSYNYGGGYVPRFDAIQQQSYCPGYQSQYQPPH